MSTSIEWTELIKDRKGVITKDNQSCGNVIGDDDENIIIEDGAVRQHFYRVPKSAAGAYNGAELTLNISYDELKTYEDKDEDKGIVESVTETIKDKTKVVKEKTVDKIDDDDYKERDRKRFDQDTQTSIDTNNQYRENRGKELNRNIDSGEKSDESSTNIASSFTCERCNTKFTSRQELKEHFSSQH
jgi:Zinc-finger of C2H2 type